MRLLWLRCCVRCTAMFASKAFDTMRRMPSTFQAYFARQQLCATTAGFVLCIRRGSAFMAPFSLFQTFRRNDFCPWCIQLLRKLLKQSLNQELLLICLWFLNKFQYFHNLCLLLYFFRSIEHKNSAPLSCLLQFLQDFVHSVLFHIHAQELCLQKLQA